MAVLDWTSGYEGWTVEILLSVMMKGYPLLGTRSYSRGEVAQYIALSASLTLWLSIGINEGSHNSVFLPRTPTNELISPHLTSNMN